MWCFVSGWVASCQRYHGLNMIHILAPAIKLTTLKLTSRLLAASQELENWYTYIVQNIIFDTLDATYWSCHSFLLIPISSLTETLQDLISIHVLEKIKNVFEESASNSEMSWIMCYNGCHGFYPARHNWFNLFIAVIDGRSVFTAVKWKIGML